MCIKNTFKINFWAHSARAKNGKCPLLVRITVNGKKTSISLKLPVNLKYWDSKKQRASGTNQESKQMNAYLDQVHSKIFQIYQDLTYREELISAELIKSHFTGEFQNTRSLQNLLNYHENKIKSSLTAGTVKNFGVTQKYVKEFLKKNYKTTDIYLKQLDYKFLCDFQTYLENYWPKKHPKAMGKNTVMKHIQRLRKIVTLGFHMEWIEKDPFIRWKPVYEKNEREFLSEGELKALENYDFPIERLDRVRDLFIFSCYTGISYADLVKLTKMNLHFDIDGKKWIITKRQKTKTPVKIPLLEKAHEILIKYDGHPITSVTETLLPVITNEKLNLYLKEVAHACEIRKNLTFHMSRHTFATTVTLSNGVPIETVSRLLGHTKIATTQIYARVLDKKISEDMGVLAKKLKKRD